MRKENTTKNLVLKMKATHKSYPRKDMTTIRKTNSVVEIIEDIAEQMRIIFNDNNEEQKNENFDIK